jgi:hypothetical protein
MLNFSSKIYFLSFALSVPLLSNTYELGLIIMSIFIFIKVGFCIQDISSFQTYRVGHTFDRVKLKNHFIDLSYLQIYYIYRFVLLYFYTRLLINSFIRYLYNNLNDFEIIRMFSIFLKP